MYGEGAGSSSTSMFLQSQKHDGWDVDRQALSQINQRKPPARSTSESTRRAHLGTCVSDGFNIDTISKQKVPGIATLSSRRVVNVTYSNGLLVAVSLLGHGFDVLLHLLLRSL